MNEDQVPECMHPVVLINHKASGPGPKQVGSCIVCGRKLERGGWCQEWKEADR